MSRFARIPECIIRCREVSRSDLRIYACIRLHADASGRAWPSMATIAEITGIRRQDIPRIVRRLTRLTDMQYEPGRGRGRPSVYTFLSENANPAGNVRTHADIKDEKCPQNSERNVRKTAREMSAPGRRKHTKEHTKEQKAEGGPSACTQFDPEKPVFDYGKDVLGQSAGGQIRKLIRRHDGDLDATMATLRLAARKQDPREYVGAIVNGQRQP